MRGDGYNFIWAAVGILLIVVLVMVLTGNLHL